jgi:hypothetical protein
MRIEKEFDSGTEFYYLSSHKDSKLLNASGVATFVSKCSK